MAEEQTQETHLLGGDWILGNPPTIAETIRQFKDGQDELALGRPSFLEPCLQRELLNVGGVGGGCREVADGLGCVGLASPSVPGHKVWLVLRVAGVIGQSGRAAWPSQRPYKRAPAGAPHARRRDRGSIMAGPLPPNFGGAGHRTKVAAHTSERDRRGPGSRGCWPPWDRPAAQREPSTPPASPPHAT